MPIRRDWFKQMMEELAGALGAALGLKRRGQVQEAVAAADESFTKAFGMSGRLALVFPLDHFLALACKGEAPDAEMLGRLAESFRQWGEVLEAAGRKAEAAAALARAAECETRKNAA